jgi:hypothetical protein
MIALGTEQVERELETGGDRHETARAYRARYGHLPDSVVEDRENDEVHVLLGACEGCREPIFEDEDCQRWEDGIVSHKGECPKGERG